MWKLYMIFEPNKEFMENLSLQRSTESDQKAVLIKILPKYKFLIY